MESHVLAVEHAAEVEEKNDKMKSAEDDVPMEPMEPSVKGWRLIFRWVIQSSPHTWRRDKISWC